MKTKFCKAGGISKAVDLGLGRGRAPSLLLPVPSWGAQGRGSAGGRGGFTDLDPHKKKNLNISQS